MLTPYLFKSNKRKTSQEHPSAKERSSMLKTLKTAGTMLTSIKQFNFLALRYTILKPQAQNKKTSRNITQFFRCAYINSSLFSQERKLRMLDLLK